MESPRVGEVSSMPRSKNVCWQVTGSTAGMFMTRRLLRGFALAPFLPLSLQDGITGHTTDGFCVRSTYKLRSDSYFLDGTLGSNAILHHLSPYFGTRFDSKRLLRSKEPSGRSLEFCMWSSHVACVNVSVLRSCHAAAGGCGCQPHWTTWARR